MNKIIIPKEDSTTLIIIFLFHIQNEHFSKICKLFRPRAHSLVITIMKTWFLSHDYKQHGSK